MLNAIGLALDLVGAALLSVGLFGRPLPLYPGWMRSPWDVAFDWSYGGSGFVFLASGFLFQALPSFGVRWHATHGEAIEAALVTLIVGGVGARLAQQLILGWRHRVAKAQANVGDVRWQYSLRFQPKLWPRLNLWKGINDGD